MVTGLAQGPMTANRVSEADRLAALRAYGILDTPREPVFDEITQVAALACKAPIALVSFVEDTRQFFKAEVGLGARETPIEQSVCVHALLQRDLFVVPDTTLDPRFACNTLVTGKPHIRFYAGVPLETPEGIPLGTLCVLDTQPRPQGLTDEQASVLRALARAVMAQLDLRRSNKALKDSEARLQLALDAGHIGTWAWHSVTRQVTADANCARMFSVSPDRAASGAPVEAFLGAIHPDDRPRVAAVLARVVRRGGEYKVQHRLVQGDGSLRWVVARGRCEHDEAGRPVHFSGVTVDVTDLKRAQEGQELLSRELSHRIKNIFAVVGGLAALSARGHPEAKGFADEFRQRVNALAQAHEYVRPQGPDGIPGGSDQTVLGLMRVLLAPYRQGERERFAIRGEDVPVGPKSATALALIMHEQATNAVKYGALSNEAGLVTLTGERDGDLYRLTWEERGGPPVEGAPERKGFGTQMAARSVTGQLGGTLTNDWAETGLTVRLNLPVQALLD